MALLDDLLSGVTNPDPNPVPATQKPSLLPSSNERYKETSGKHTGVAGVARDILGTLGDFLLTRLHMKPMYAPAQERRKLSEAEQGYGTDPQATADAISRVASIDPNRADKLRDQYIDNTRLAAQQQSTQEAREQRLSLAQDKAHDTALSRAANYFNGIASLDPKKRPEAYANGRKLFMNSATVRNDPELQQKLNDFYPENYDENLLTASIGQYTPVAQQWRAALDKDKLAETQEHNDATEALGEKRLGETSRHNRVTEGQGSARIGIAERRAAAVANRPARVSNIQTYVGEDGYKYTKRSDGTTVKSDIKVRPAGKAPAAPPVGYKNKYGLTFKGGDPSNRANWQ